MRIFVIIVGLISLTACTSTALQEPIKNNSVVVSTNNVIEDAEDVSTHIIHIYQDWHLKNQVALKEHLESLDLLLNDPSGERRRIMLKKYDMSDLSINALEEFVNAEPVEPEEKPIQIQELERDNGISEDLCDKKTNCQVQTMAYSLSWLEVAIKGVLVDFGENSQIKVPDEFVGDVNKHIVRFTQANTRSGRWFKRSLNRYDKYYPMIKGIFAKRHLPEAFYYMALIESGFNPHARSSAGAVGLWQFMRGTGKQYKLKITRRVDERKDPVKSTVAAREYLNNLILDFGDGHSMLLAMAAYNAGEGRIRSRLRRLNDYRDRSFWALSKKNLLPKETAEYVPQIIAAAIISQNREQFANIDHKQISLAQPDYKLLTLYKSLSIRHILKHGKWNREELITLNPDLADNAIVTPSARYDLKLPVSVYLALQNDSAFKQAQLQPIIHTTIASAQLKVEPAVIQKESKKYVIYTVKKGNTLSWLSNWSGVIEAKIKARNPKLKKRRYLVAGEKLYLLDVKKGLKRYQYQVKTGDTLSEIADIYQVKLSWLKSWNGLYSSRIRKGQRLSIYADQQLLANKKIVTQSKPVKIKSKRKLGYIVQRGNSLKTIANAFNVTIKQIKRQNRLKKSTIYPGQKITIPVGSWKKRYVKVKRGDTLAKIAQRYHVKARQIQTYNGMRNSRVLLGEELVLYQRI